MIGRQFRGAHEDSAPSLPFDIMRELHGRRIIRRAILQDGGDDRRQVARRQPRIDRGAGGTAEPFSGPQLAEWIACHPGNGVT